MELCRFWEVGIMILGRCGSLGIHFGGLGAHLRILGIVVILGVLPVLKSSPLLEVYCSH